MESRRGETFRISRGRSDWAFDRLSLYAGGATTQSAPAQSQRHALARPRREHALESAQGRQPFLVAIDLARTPERVAAVNRLLCDRARSLRAPSGGRSDPASCLPRFADGSAEPHPFAPSHG